MTLEYHTPFFRPTPSVLTVLSLVLFVTTACGDAENGGQDTPTATPATPSTPTPVEAATETPEVGSPSPEAESPAPDDGLRPLEDKTIPFQTGAIILTVAGTGATGDDCVVGQPCNGTPQIYGYDVYDEYYLKVFNTTGGYAGDFGPAPLALLNWPTGVAVGPNGMMAIADQENAAVRCVSPEGIITTCGKTMGNTHLEPGEHGFWGPGGLTFDPAGNLYVADTWDYVVTRKLAGGLHEAYVGDASNPESYDSEGQTLIDAALVDPTGVTLDSAGNLYIADFFNCLIRKVDHETQVVTTVAGSWYHGYEEGGLAIESGLNYPGGIALDSHDNLYITDNFSHSIRRVDAKTQRITTVAGTGEAGFSGDGGPATEATLNFPTGLDFDSKGNLFFTDMRNNLVRVITPDGRIYTVAGNGLHRDDLSGSFSGDGGEATSAGLNNPYGLAVDDHDNLLIADTNNNRIRKVTFLK